MTQNYVKRRITFQTAIGSSIRIINGVKEELLYDQYERELGTVTQVYNNTTGAGEQVYAVVKNPDEKAEDVQESYAIL